jgi:hypothetical protein
VLKGNRDSDALFGFSLGSFLGSHCINPLA